MKRWLRNKVFTTRWHKKFTMQLEIQRWRDDEKLTQCIHWAITPRWSPCLYTALWTTNRVTTAPVKFFNHEKTVPFMHKWTKSILLWNWIRKWISYH